MTSGLASELGEELVLDVTRAGSPEVLFAAKNLVRFLAQYFLDLGKTPEEGDKVDWASSLLICRRAAPGVLTFDELEFDGETVAPGVSTCTTVWVQQSDVCHQFKSEFRPARFGQLVSLSPGALDDCAKIEGVRYPAPSHMSGWWLFADGYDGAKDDFRSMVLTHVFEALQKQPRLAPVLGLDCGFAFRTGPAASASQLHPEVWFEQDVAAQGVP